MATEYELTVSDYLSIMRRRAPYMIAIFCCGFADCNCGCLYYSAGLPRNRNDHGGDTAGT